MEAVGFVFTGVHYMEDRPVNVPLKLEVAYSRIRSGLATSQVTAGCRLRLVTLTRDGRSIGTVGCDQTSCVVGLNNTEPSPS